MAALKTLDDSIKQLAQRNYSQALKAMAATKQIEAARLLGCSESTLSEWSSDHLERAMQVISALGLKLVTKDSKTFPKEEIESYRYFTRKALAMDEPNSDFGELM